MARCDTTERIAASPTRVWVYFQPDKMKQWYGPEVTLLTPGPLQKGSRIQVTGRSGAKSFGYEATVTEYAENRSLAWEGQDQRTRYRIAFLLTPKEGQTVILLRDEFHVKALMGRLIERFFMAGRVAKYDRHFIAQLKKRVESR